MIQCPEKNICASCPKQNSCRVLEKIAPFFSTLEKIPDVNFFFDIKKCGQSQSLNMTPLDEFVLKK